MKVALSVFRREPGRGGARSLRRKGFIPAVIYGSGRLLSVACEARVVAAYLRDSASHVAVLTLNMEGENIPVLIREVQRHPYRREVLHMDFQAVHEDREISASVPLVFTNVEKSPGVRLSHGIFTSIENEIAVHCLPRHLPESIEVDVGDLAIGRSIHLSDVEAPPGVRFDARLRGDDLALAIISEPGSDDGKDESDDSSQEISS